MEPHNIKKKKENFTVNRDLKERVDKNFLRQLRAATKPYGHIRIIAKKADIHRNTLCAILKSGLASGDIVKKISKALNLNIAA